MPIGSVIGICILKISEAEALEAEFNEVMRRVMTAPGAVRVAVAYGVAFLWKLFDAEFGSAEAFQIQPRSVQLAYLEKLTKLEESMAQRDPQVSLGVALTKMYLAPIIERNGTMVNRMADHIEPLNREGSILLLGTLPNANDQGS